MHYQLSISNAAEHFIQLKWTITNLHQPTICLQLPAWRPGRYELANYAKNIRCLQITNENGVIVPFKKTTKDCWEVNCAGCHALVIQYEYYANQYDAGASYADATQLYINPVNCFMYAHGRMDEAYAVELLVPDDYSVACQLPLKNKTLYATNFDELADSPFIASATLQHHEFVVATTRMHFWFQGKHDLDMNLLEEDTIAYTKAQINVFGELPCKDYHFLYIMHPYPFRHGVEHANSTVIAMGKAETEIRDEFYHSLLAISSHELFHLWNIKRIRPTEMLPYDFTKENYSTLGYVYEGVTTYYGDQILLRCGTWSWEQYCSSFNSDLKRHLTNPGRFNYSVAASSFDTWLDGYVPGIAGRKVSIYMEGMLAALIADLMIINHSESKYSLDDVMKALYKHYKEGKGYDEALYKQLLEQFAGISFDAYFNEVIHGVGNIELWLTQYLDKMGCKLAEAKGETVLVINPNPSEKQKKIFNYWLRNTME
ncbi:MAG: M61 family metallopeptidase [Bacteroidota bacterium]|jgi:predicted metalloprotease with PDZ domain|nr:hypothetical protein [Sphingobacteriales bacterium]